MCSALSLFVKEERVILLNKLELKEIKTSELNKVLTKLGADHALIIDSNENENLKLSARNLSRHKFLPIEGINVFDILKHDQLIMTKEAVLAVQERLERPVRSRRAS
jgi:large subunit ribosomal protein L4